MKQPRQTGTPKFRRTPLRTATVETKIVPQDYKPPSKPPRARKTGGNVAHPLPPRYSRKRGLKPVTLPPQPETLTDRGDRKEDLP